MEQRPLALNDVPVIIIIWWGQILNRTRHKIRNNCIERHTVAGDQNTRLTRCTECRLHALGLHRFVQCQSGVHLTNRTICAHSQDALTRALLAGCDWVINRCNTHVVQFAAIRFSSCNQISFISQKVVQARRKVVAHVQRFNQDFFPRSRDNAATVCNANNKRLCASSLRLSQSHVAQTNVSATAFHTELCDSVVRAPVFNALRNFCSQLVRRVAQEQKIRCFDHCRCSQEYVSIAISAKSSEIPFLSALHSHLMSNNRASFGKNSKDSTVLSNPGRLIPPLARL